MEEIRKFLSEHEEHQDEFWESDALIWVDWRDFDESIIEYFNKKLPDEDKIQFECVDVSYRITCNNGNQRTLINP